MLGEQGSWPWVNKENQEGMQFLSYPTAGLSRSGWKHMGGAGWGRALWRCSCCTRSIDRYMTLVAMAGALAFCSSMKTPPSFVLWLSVHNKTMPPFPSIKHCCVQTSGLGKYYLEENHPLSRPGGLSRLQAAERRSRAQGTDLFGGLLVAPVAVPPQLQGSHQAGEEEADGQDAEDSSEAV